MELKLWYIFSRLLLIKIFLKPKINNQMKDKKSEISDEEDILLCYNIIL